VIPHPRSCIGVQNKESEEVAKAQQKGCRTINIIIIYSSVIKCGAYLFAAVPCIYLTNSMELDTTREILSC
jgi:hypothetical protein